MKHPSISDASRQGDQPEPEIPATLWLIRHAEVEPRYHAVFGGRIDMELSERGHRQASALALYLRDKRFDALYASPMRRVQQTLAPLLSDPRLPQPVTFSELREVDFGDWTGLSWDQVQQNFGVSAFSWLEQLDRNTIPNAESGEALRRRLEPVLRRIVRAHPGHQVAVLCHGGVIRMIMAILMGWRISAMGAFEIDYASITQASVSPDRVRLQLINFTPWRDVQPSVAAETAQPDPESRISASHQTSD